MPRPPLADRRKTDSPLRIRLTPEDRAMLDQAAGWGGLPTSSWARTELLRLARMMRLGRDREATKKLPGGVDSDG